ncbi:conserved hypothetical protein [Sphingomonas sp. EC-HK361]|nr:conserved hypothetical protein [Sphingomonas sp. EC-HK361]
MSRVTPANRGVFPVRRAARLRWRDAMIAPALLVAAACSSQPDDPGAVTPEEAQQLNDAAAMLDANSVDANAVMTTDNGTARP